MTVSSPHGHQFILPFHVHLIRIDFEGLTNEGNQRLAAGMMCETKVKVE